MGSLLGIDIGGTRVKAARVDTDGGIEAAGQWPTPDSPDAFASLARRITFELGTGVAGIGIGCKGIIDAETTRIDVLPGTLRYLEGRLLRDLFAIDGVPCVADNDARVALLGECRWGAGRGHSDVVMLTLGTGVGGGILSGGRVLRGSAGIGGHLGHITVEVDGEPCICGNRGCLETVFSSRAIEAAAYALIHRGVESRLLEFDAPPSCREVFKVAAEGDRAASEIVFRATYALAGALAGLALALDPAVIILGGQIAEAGEYLLAPLRQEIHERTRSFLRREVPVVRSGLDDPSGVLGAAALALDHAGG